MVLMYCTNTYIGIDGGRATSLCTHLDKVEACVQKGICCKIFAKSSMQIISISFISPS